MDTFKVKYLFNLFPHIDFEDEFVVMQEVVSMGYEYESQDTGRNYALVYDNYLDKRHIQTLKKEKWSVKFELSRNIDINTINVGYTTLTTTAGDTFVIRNVQITIERIPNSRNFIITITFYNYSNEVVNHLSSANAAIYHAGTPNANVIAYTVHSPSLVFNNVTTYLHSISGNKCCFKVPLDAITTQINIDDIFYLHTDNTAFNVKLDGAGYYMAFAKCHDKDTDYVYFQCSSSTLTVSYVYVINTLRLDYNTDYRTPRYTAVPITMSFNIYTFINPIITNKWTIEGELNSQKGVTESDQMTSQYNAHTKVFLTDAEVYLAEYLNYATFDDITLTLSDATVYRPTQTKDLIKEVERDNLIGLHEYDINLLYNVHNTNLNR